MKRMHVILAALGGAIVLAGLALGLQGCAEKKEVVPLPVGEMTEYRDQVLGFRVKHPKDWIVDAEAGRRARFWSGQNVSQRFLDPTGAYPDGALIGIEVTKTADPDSEKNRLLTEWKGMNIQLTPEEQITVSGKPATKVTTTANWGGGTIIYDRHVFINLDSVLYDLRFGGVKDSYAAHSAIFDAALASFELPKPAEKGRDETLPSESMSEYDAKLFTFQYPENFNFVSAPKGTNDLVLALRGVRQDCSIRFDVFPAKGQTLDKVFEQNKGKFATTGSGKTTIGGLPAMYLQYNATRDVERRFYFTVKDDKVYRTTMDYFRPQRTEYLAAYEKVLSSIKFK